MAAIGRMSRYAMVMRHGGQVFAEGYLFHKGLREPQEPLRVAATVPIEPPELGTARARCERVGRNE